MSKKMEKSVTPAFTPAAVQAMQYVATLKQMEQDLRHAADKENPAATWLDDTLNEFTRLTDTLVEFALEDSGFMPAVGVNELRIVGPLTLAVRAAAGQEDK